MNGLNQQVEMFSHLMRRYTKIGLILSITILDLPTLAYSSGLPAEASAQSTQQHVGKIVYLELVTPDIDEAVQFYGHLFGWQFVESNRNGSRFADATLNGHVIGGILNVGRSAIPGRQPNWLSFISTSDVDRLARETEARGGKIVRMPRNTPGRGRDAILRDPHGAVFAVLKGNTEDPPDELVEVGDWIWSSLLTTDPDHDAGFYQSLFDYDVFETPDSNEKSQHLLLSADDYARASVNSLPAANKKARPHWLNYVRVNSADTTIAQAISLGGKVLVSPRVDRHGDKVGVIADPAGAPFGLLEWRPDTEIETVR